MVDITRRNFHHFHEFFIWKVAEKNRWTITGNLKLDPVKERENLKSNFSTSLFFQSLNELNSDPKYAIKRKFAYFFCYFPNKVHYIQADFSEGKLSCFKCLKPRFHKRKSWSKHSTQDIFFSIFATFCYDFWECVF